MPGTEAPATWIVVGAYALWLILSITMQAPAIGRRIRRVDVLRLVFMWTLFDAAPRLTALAWRDQRRDHAFTEWQPVSLTSRSGWLTALWHPLLLRPHLLYLSTLGIVRALRPTAAGGLRVIEETFAYRTLWHYVMRLPRTSGAAARQFEVMVLDDLTRPRAVYVSAMRKFLDR